MKDLFEFIISNFWMIILLFILLIDKKYRFLGIILTSFKIMNCFANWQLWVMIILIISINSAQHYQSTSSEKKESRTDPDYTDKSNR